ncbi:MAG: hypothetical protein M3R26_06545 [Actinomycetota bacterium]|nr:hypothetical protein [Actinomycetota bacterium]
MGRRKLFALGLAAGSLLGIGLYAKRGRKRERVDLYFADGSMVSVAGDSPEAARLMPLARDAVRAARS